MSPTERWGRSRQTLPSAALGHRHKAEDITEMLVRAGRAAGHAEYCKAVFPPIPPPPFCPSGRYTRGGKTVCNQRSAAPTQLRTRKQRHNHPLPLHHGEKSAGPPAVPPHAERDTGRESRAAYVKEEDTAVAGMNQSCFVVSWCVGRGAAPRTWAHRDRSSPSGRAPPTQRATAAERDTGQGSSGFSSFDGHGARFDMV